MEIQRVCRETFWCQMMTLEGWKRVSIGILARETQKTPLEYSRIGILEVTENVLAFGWKSIRG